ncbi:MAG: M14 family metallopeptidase [Planctomycetota bacterium]
MPTTLALSWLAVTLLLQVPQSRPERTGYQETSRHSDVMEFLAAFQKSSPLIRVETFGWSERGRPLPLAILHDPPVSTPLQARSLLQPVFFVMANIHAGEVDGKEACLHLIRDLIAGKDPLLAKVILLVAPIFNADGNEEIDASHRRHQHGPFGGVGVRTTASGLDLNRDFTKLRAVETRALVRRIFNDWNPHVVVDCHTTDGSYHGFSLTFAPGQHPDSHEALTALTRDRLLPEAAKRVKERSGHEISFYGDFKDDSDPSKGWVTYDWRARYGVNCVGLRNRIGILSEAYVYRPFQERIEATRHFLYALLEIVAESGAEVIETVARADAETVALARAPSRPLFGLDCEIRAFPEPITVPVRAVRVDREAKPASPMVEILEEKERVTTPYFGYFEATRTRSLPAAYLVLPGYTEAIKLLQAHGLVVERLTQAGTLDLEAARVMQVERSRRPFQGGLLARLTIEIEARTIEAPPGSWLVRMDQPLARLAFHLLEPDSDDGLFAWGFFDTALSVMTPGAEQAIAPVYRVTLTPPLATELVRDGRSPEDS